MKHGSLALIDKDFPSILFAPHDAMLAKNKATLQEIKARGGPVVTIGDEVLDSDHHINIPSTMPELYPFLTAVVAQLLAYYTAAELERDIDKPRNLAKSVTVS